jgi:hypothetical protein
VKNVGGVYETPKSVEQVGEDVYAPTPVALQKSAVDFLNKQLFETPDWLLNKNILNKISNPVAGEALGNVQVNVLNSLFSAARLNRMAVGQNRFGAKGTYAPDAMMDDVKKGIWSELTSKKAIDGYRRNLQKAYVEALVGLINPNQPQAPMPGQGAPVNTRNTDVPSVAHAQLVALKAQVAAAIPGTADKMSKYHLQDMLFRITKALDPRG